MQIVPVKNYQPKQTAKLLAQCAKAGRNVNDLKFTAIDFQTDSGNSEFAASINQMLVDAGSEITNKLTEKGYDNLYVDKAMSGAASRAFGIAFQTEAYLASLNLPEVTEEEIAPYRNTEKAEKVQAQVDAI